MDRKTDLRLWAVAFWLAVWQLAAMALADGCTKTNPIIPTAGQMEALFTLVFDGKEA